jgi:DNA-binding FadR family transcriptional regulator
MLAERLYGDSPTRSQLESVRRAIRALVAEGLVESNPGGVSMFRAAEWPDRPDGRHRRLVARIPLKKSELREESRHVAAAIERYEAARAAAGERPLPRG